MAWAFACVAFFALFSFAGAQSGNDTEAALRELGEKIGASIRTEDDAKRACNEERYLSVCVDIGKKYHLYGEERLRRVDEFLEEARDTLVGELQSCANEECLLNAAKKLTEKITKKNPKLASDLELTSEEIQKKEVVVNAARDAGVSIAECKGMNPDVAPVELLRACAKVAKDVNVGGEFDETSIALREALRAGTYQCGDGTPEGCGNFCLNSGVEAGRKGATGIPEVCRNIAATFYGAEGLRALETAYAEVREVEKFFEQKKEKKAFITYDGRTLYAPKEIGAYIEEEGRRGNTEVVGRGMDYLIQYGFVKPEDKIFALKFVENIKQSGRAIDFEECGRNPEACREFVPEDVGRVFGKAEEAHRIVTEEMRKAGVPTPEDCTNEEYGERCVLASMSALPKLEEMAREFPEVRYVAEEVRKYAGSGRGQLGARVKAKEEFAKTGKLDIGGREFTSFSEMTDFCRVNGSLCLAEAAKKGFVEKDVAAEKYKEAFDIQYRTPLPEETASKIVSSAIGPEQREELVNEFRRWLENPVGAPPISFGERTKALPYSFQERQGGTSYYMTQEMERCLAERGVGGEGIEAIRRGGRVEDPSIERLGSECARDIAAGDYGAKEPEVSVLPREDEEGLLQTITKPFRSIVKPIVGELFPKEDGLDASYPYTFSDGFIAKTRSEAEAHCREYPPESGRSIAGECGSKIGVLYDETQKREYVNWVQRTWTFVDTSTEFSYVLDRTDSEYLDYLKSIERKCANIQRYKFRWNEKAGDSAPENWRNFGIPDCSGEKIIGDPCYAQYGPGWVSKDSTKNCYDAYGSNFKTPEGKVYSCNAIPTGVSASGCMKQTTEEAPRPVYGTSPSDCSSAQYWDNNAKTCAIYTCPTGFTWSAEIGGCKNTKDGSPICPPSNYWNTATKRCETLKCTPPLYWDDWREVCVKPELIDDPLVDLLKGYCTSNISQSSCYAQSGCKWVTENGKNFCTSAYTTERNTACNYNGTCDYGESSGSCPNDCGGGDVGRCGAYTSEATCTTGQNCGWYRAKSSNETSYCYYSSGGGGGTSSNWVSHLWTFSNGTQPSSILNRTDQEYLDYIKSIEAVCKTVKRENFCWKSGAGSDTDWKSFGIPDCSGTCSGGAASSTYSGGQGGGTSSCSSALVSLLGAGCHWMYSASDGKGIYCDGPMTKSAKEGDVATTSGCTSSSGGGGQYPGDQNSCPGFAYSVWDGAGKRYCKLNTKESCQYTYPDYLTELNYASTTCPTATSGGGGSSSCSAALKTLLGADCHYMYQNASGQSVYCDGPMTKSAKEGDTATTSGCSSYTGGTGGGSTTACNNNGVCDSGESSGSCPSDCASGGGGSGTSSGCGTYTTQSNCTGTSGCAWDSASSYCYSSGGSGGGTSSCSASLQALLGTGCHYMHVDSSGKSVYCDSVMTKSAKEGDTATIAGCLSGSSGGGGSGGGDYGSCGGYATQSTCAGQPNCYWYNSTGSGSSYCYYSLSGGAYGGEKKGFATVLDAVKKIFWTLSY